MSGFRHFAAAILVLSALAAHPTAGQDARTPDESACADVESQPELNDCYGRILQRTDAELAELYERLRMHLEDARRRALLAATQQAWTAFRDRECAFETADSEGGSIHPMELYICRTAEARTRIAELNRQLDCPEGDLTCTH